MSFNLYARLTKIFQHSNIPVIKSKINVKGSDLSLLRCYADVANDGANNIWLSDKLAASRIGVSHRTVVRARKHLIEQNILVPIEKRVGTSDLYGLNLPLIDELERHKDEYLVNLKRGLASSAAVDNHVENKSLPVTNEIQNFDLPPKMDNLTGGGMSNWHTNHKNNHQIMNNELMSSCTAVDNSEPEKKVRPQAKQDFVTKSEIESAVEALNDSNTHAKLIILWIRTHTYSVVMGTIATMHEKIKEGLKVKVSVGALVHAALKKLLEPEVSNEAQPNHSTHSYSHNQTQEPIVNDYQRKSNSKNKAVYSAAHKPANPNEPCIHVPIDNYADRHLAIAASQKEPVDDCGAINGYSQIEQSENKTDMSDKPEIEDKIESNPPPNGPSSSEQPATDTVPPPSYTPGKGLTKEHLATLAGINSRVQKGKERIEKADLRRKGNPDEGIGTEALNSLLRETMGEENFTKAKLALGNT
jgi:hypothetical protein